MSLPLANNPTVSLTALGMAIIAIVVLSRVAEMAFRHITRRDIAGGKPCLEQFEKLVSVEGKMDQVVQAIALDTELLQKLTTNGQLLINILERIEQRDVSCAHALASISADQRRIAEACERITDKG